MTTSIAWFARGRLLASFYLQPMGFVIAVVAGMTLWAGAYMAMTGRPVHRLLRFLPARYYLLPLFGFWILAWVWKIGIHLTGHDGWG